MKTIYKGAIGLAALICLVGGTSYVRLTVPAKEAAEFRDYTAVTYYKYGVLPNTIVYDIREIGPEASAASVMGGFFKFAEIVKDRDYDEIHLASRGKVKFILDGEDFKSIGRTFPYDNSVETVSKFPEKLRRPDGTAAFEKWSGGWLHVMGQQMNDVNELASEWFVQDAMDAKLGK